MFECEKLTKFGFRFGRFASWKFPSRSHVTFKITGGLFSALYRNVENVSQTLQHFSMEKRSDKLFQREKSTDEISTHHGNEMFAQKLVIL